MGPIAIARSNSGSASSDLLSWAASNPEKVVRVWLVRLPLEDLAIHLLCLGEAAVPMLRHRDRQEGVHLSGRGSLRCWLAGRVCELIGKREAVRQSAFWGRLLGEPW